MACFGPLRPPPPDLDYRTEAPALIRDFLTYHRTIQGHSLKTVDEYYLDMRTFFRFMKLQKGLVPRDTDFEAIAIDDVDLDLARSVTLTDVYAFMDYLDRDRSLSAPTRARKVATIRSFYKYLTNKAKLITENPMQDLDSPRLKKALPRYLTLEQSIQLLESVDEPNRARDYCILTLFLNCGMRISELVALDLTDIRQDQLRVLGKGNKERVLYLNDACRQALDDWLEERESSASTDPNALFITRRHGRMTKDAVHYMVKQRLKKAGLDSSLYSSHKLRHTAATLMLQNGVDVRTLQEVLGHDNLNTTQIYTHVESDDLRLAAKANPLGAVHRKKGPDSSKNAKK
ncbi:tyrosine recombinase XerC [Pseudoflavonifractor sp. MSJ-37]|uniref:tyrosine recombinase XerC n=1 Tax=Pseudoflavonifractor sp. MSJ-37 TaxID=2841531 RepID=UPI001C0FE9DB|nr:tyrosine recombinase XerC [Pseudoflavonifractor sp. MSJ-37]MBU5434766.1 tyrosine recombinase XerC [Pseudoflavonifractor sp. MSJ-37]